MFCQHHGIGGNHGTSFLCLPSSIRCRIYIEADLVKNCHRIQLTPPRRKQMQDPIVRIDNAILRRVRTSLQLMQTCRVIYEEVSRVFYSTNRFVAQYLETSQLFMLLSLRPQSISHLTHLTLYLNVIQCNGRDPFPKHSSQAWEWADWWTPNEVPLYSHRPADQALLSQWSEIARHLAAHVTPLSLRLCLGCDVGDAETAMLVLSPLLQMPRLASCVIRLGHSPDSELQRLADNIVIQLTDIPTTRDLSYFPFMSLPRELRLDILQYTDLVTPLCEVTWARDRGYHTKFLSWRPNAGYTWHGGRWQGAARFRSCYPSSTGCFCPRYHAVSPTDCSCWAPPTPLFLVCKLMKVDADEVFFRKNRLAILHSGGKHFVASETPARLDASLYLRSVSSSYNLAFIRVLEITFPPFEDDYLQASEPAYQDWLRTIEHLQAHMRLSQLTLRIYMREQIPAWSDRTEIPFRANMTSEKSSKIIQMYWRVLSPLASLKGLCRLFLHVAVPHERNTAGLIGGSRYTGDGDSHERDGIAIEQEIERSIMGPDYDSTKLGKYQLEDSQWRADEMFDFIFRGRYTALRNTEVVYGLPEPPRN